MIIDDEIQTNSLDALLYGEDDDFENMEEDDRDGRYYEAAYGALTEQSENIDADF